MPLGGSASVQLCGSVAEAVLSSAYFQWQAMLGIFVAEINVLRCLDGNSEASLILVALCRSALHCGEYLRENS
jgi:hypothetical protein